MCLFALFSPFLGGRFVFHTAPLLFHLGFSTEFLAGLYPTRATLSKSLAAFPRKPATIRYKVCMHSARMILYAVAALACVSPLSDTAFGFFSSDWKKARILGVFGTRESHLTSIFFRLYPYKLCLSTSLVHVQTGVCVWCQVAALRSRQSVDRVCVSHRVFVLVPSSYTLWQVSANRAQKLCAVMWNAYWPVAWNHFGLS